MATYKEGEDEAGYFEDAKPETHKVSASSQTLPQAVLTRAPTQVSLEPYRRESLKILKVFSEFCSTIGEALNPQNTEGHA